MELNGGRLEGSGFLVENGRGEVRWWHIMAQYGTACTIGILYTSYIHTHTHYTYLPLDLHTCTTSCIYLAAPTHMSTYTHTNPHKPTPANTCTDMHTL